MIDKRIIARDEVRYHVVVAVAAIDEVTAEKAVSLIEVEYEVLPAVHTIDEALEGKILVHEDINDLDYMKGVFFPQPDSNIASWNTTKKGDIEKGFAEADLIVENEFTLPAVAHAPMETHVSVAQAILLNKKVWSSSHLPYLKRYVGKGL